jgi:NAD+ kinase
LDLLKTRVFSSNEIEFFSINELTVRKSDFTSLRSDVYINNDLLENYIGDGLVVSTSIGSTGYNLALSGPIVDPNLNAYVLTSIAPINNKVYSSLSNSMVIAGDKKITIIPSDNNNVCILIDGKIRKIDNINKIECIISSNRIKCIVPKNYNYINNVRKKVINTLEGV